MVLLFLRNLERLLVREADKNYVAWEIDGGIPYLTRISWALISYQMQSNAEQKAI
jgi:hypothetical protein